MILDQIVSDKKRRLPEHKRCVSETDLALSAAAYFLARYTKVTGVAAYLLSGIAAYAGGYLLYELIKRIPVIRWCVIGEKKERKHVQR